MRVVYDSSQDILDIYLSEAERLTSKEILPGVIADLDKKGNIISLEILDAKERYGFSALEECTFNKTTV
ncbi:MAG: hypothetical protein HW403_1157 [Dehalococcoidia bacterium]|nr:hypothetical protein [Dehalococcoidia bacterium]